MADGEPLEVDRSAFLRDLAPEQFNVRVPAPVAQRADQLVERLLEQARALGAVSRGELVAALIHDAPPDASQLRAKVERYREARVWETILGTRRKAGKLVIHRKARGRPRRRSS
jgi:hypothetical protein